MSKEREAIIDQLLDEWEDAYDAGLNISPEELCANHPDVLEEVREKIGILQTMDKRLADQSSNESDQTDHRADDSFRVDSKYDDLEQLDAGGLGIVYRAIDTELNRDVAVKFLRDPGHDQWVLEQFKAEAEITGRLDHPGVVPVYAMGKAKSGEPFYSMRLIRGDSLEQAIKEFHSKKNIMKPGERWIEMRSLLTKFSSVCNTIAYAHTRGILHRDIKPHNIMLGKYGETLVVDWGLAIPFERQGQFRVLDEKTLLPQKGEGLTSSPDGYGTPAFMSPEQAIGSEVLDATSDIFSLGSTFYRMLTGELPFAGKNSLETKQLILEGEFKMPHQVDRTVSKAISHICAKALAHRKEERYQTALEMSEDIERYLADQPVSCYKESRGRKMARWARRNRSVAQWMTAALVMAFAAAVVTSIVQFRAADQQARNQARVDQSLDQALAAKENGVKLSTQLLANSIEFDLQNRFAQLERAAKEISQSGWQDDLEELTVRLENIRFDVDCVAPSRGWFIVGGEQNPICLSSDQYSDSQFANGVWQELLKSNVSSPRISFVTPASDENSVAECLLLVPVEGSEEFSTVGMIVNLSEFGSIHAEELKLAEGAIMRLLEIGNQPLAFFQSDSGSNGQSAVDVAWLRGEVAKSDTPVLANDLPGTVNSAIRIAPMTPKFQPIECDWYLLVEQ